MKVLRWSVKTSNNIATFNVENIYVERPAEKLSRAFYADSFAHQLNARRWMLKEPEVINIDGD